jgi:hypothetical protein
MLYIGAIEGNNVFLVPKHVYRMTVEQAANTTIESRKWYLDNCERKGFKASGTRWYEDNSREPIRDETLRQGLVELGAVWIDDSVATTASEGRYVLREHFFHLLDPSLTGDKLTAAIDAWRKAYLSPAALAKVQILLAGLAASEETIIITLPSKETRKMSAGPSSVITKAVVEVFAPKFLETPAVIWISESRKKVIQKDLDIARALNLNIQAEKVLPDAVLADLGAHAMLVFIEVVATDGPVTEARKAALSDLAAQAGFTESHVAYVTAFESRDSRPFKSSLPTLATGSFTWFMNEPDVLLWIKSEKSPPIKLHTLQAFA